MTDRYNGLPDLPEDIEPFTEDTWRADAHMDLCVPESAEDKRRWQKIKDEFAAKWLPLIRMMEKQAS
jgi:hypothetical protein